MRLPVPGECSTQKRKKWRINEKVNQRGQTLNDFISTFEDSGH